MKIRSGFVSNSSSSSFVLKVGDLFNTSLDVAEYMIPKREWGEDMELLNKVRHLKKTKPNLPAVAFTSCNYDTFIAKMGDLFLVETCHNQDWDLLDFATKCPEGYIEYFGDDYFYDLPRRIPFYHLEYDITGRLPDWRETKYQWCEECHSDFWVVGDRIVCPKCRKEHKTEK
jgi:hypothetical protein